MQIKRNNFTLPETTIFQSSFSTLFLQRKGARLRSYRFECSECEAQHLQAKEDGTTRLVTSTEHLATSNSVRKKEKSLKDQAKRAETKQQGDISECSSEMDGVPSPATSHAK